MMSGFAPVNGLEMYYQAHEGPSEIPLVLIHGGASTIESNWGRLIPILTRHHKVIALETQSHGRTKDIDRPFTFEQDADDVAALLKYLAIPKANVFGFSNGGQVAMKIAMRHPQVVHKLIIASIGFSRDGFYPWFWDMMAAGTFETLPPPLRESFLSVTPDTERLYAMWKRDSTRMVGFQSWPESDIQSIQSPALIVQGDNEIVKPEHAVQMYRLIAGSRLIIFPGGHGDYLGELSTGNTNTVLHELFVSMVNEFLG